MVAAGTGGVGGFLLWADLKPEDIEALDAAADEQATMTLLSTLLGLSEEEDFLKREVVLELHLNSLYFARKCDFGTEKTSTLFSITYAIEAKFVPEYSSVSPYLRCRGQVFGTRSSRKWRRH